MLEHNLNLVYASSIEKLTEANASFDRGVMRVAYHGPNRNKTYISKQAFEDSMHSIYNCPVVCNYSVRDDSIGGHDIELVEKCDGRYVMINCTQPIGVVPESANVYWETITEADGTNHEYLCTDILVWKRQSAYEHIKDNVVTDESMEIKVLSGERKDDGYYHVYKFEFTAFCLLESDAPCFESAGIELYSLNGFREKCAEMYEDLRREFSMVNTACAADINQNNSLEGGNDPLNIEELMAKYGLVEQDIDFDTADMESSELEERFAQIQESKVAVAHQEGNAAPATDEPGVNEPGNQEFSLTAQQMTQEITDALSVETVFDEYYGAMPRYYYMDYAPDTHEVYAIDSVDWKMYGFSYSVNGDVVAIDFESKKRVKVTYVEFEGEVNDEFNFKNVFDSATKPYSAKCEVLTEEVATLEAYKAQIEAKEYAVLVESVFEKFADLAENETFCELRKSCSEGKSYTVEELEEKCYAIRGRVAPAVNFSLEEPSSIRLPVTGMNTDADEPYNGIFLKYGFCRR